MIWAYMGPPERMPPLPARQGARVPASQDCNWVQAIEGSIDTVHCSFAHLALDKAVEEDLDIETRCRAPVAVPPRAVDRRRSQGQRA